MQLAGAPPAVVNRPHATSVPCFDRERAHVPHWRGVPLRDAAAERLPGRPVPACDRSGRSPTGGRERPAGDELTAVGREGAHGAVHPGSERLPRGSVPPGDVIRGDASGGREAPARDQASAERRERLDRPVEARAERVPRRSVPHGDPVRVAARGEMEDASRHENGRRRPCAVGIPARQRELRSPPMPGTVFIADHEGGAH